MNQSNDRFAQSVLQATSWTQVAVSRYKQSISRSKALREALTINGKWNVNDAAYRYNAYFTALLILVNGHKQQIYEYTTLAILLRIWTWSDLNSITGAYTEAAIHAWQAKQQGKCKPPIPPRVGDFTFRSRKSFCSILSLTVRKFFGPPHPRHQGSP